DSGLAKTVCKIDFKTGEAHHLFLVKDRETKVRGNKSGGVMGGVRHPYSSEILMAPLPGGGFCFAVNIENKIHLVDNTGKETKTVVVNIKPKPINETETAVFEKKYGKGAAKRLNLASTRPILENIVTDEKGNIYAILKKSLANRSPTQLMDTFDSKGHYLYRVKINIIPRVILKGEFYGI
ncbi:MAG: hypothetical protein GY950_27315, partial [bacterium]|nr:hypothetical protein [bacterium]